MGYLLAVFWGVFRSDFSNSHRKITNLRLGRILKEGFFSSDRWSRKRRMIYGSKKNPLFGGCCQYLHPGGKCEKRRFRGCHSLLFPFLGTLRYFIKYLSNLSHWSVRLLTPPVAAGYIPREVLDRSACDQATILYELLRTSGDFCFQFKLEFASIIWLVHGNDSSKVIRPSLLAWIWWVNS